MEAEEQIIEIELSPVIENDIRVEVRPTTSREHKRIEQQLGIRKKRWPNYTFISCIFILLASVAFVGVTANKSSTGPVSFKQLCAKGTECVIKFPKRSFPDYGNVWPNNLAICTFAAIADWESIVKNTKPNPILIGIDFGQAGGDSKNGLTMKDSFKYWKKNSINGQLLKSAISYKPSEKNLKNTVRQYGAVLASLQLKNGGYLGELRTSAGGHEIVVDGFTPSGPEIVTWGQTLVISWKQWKDVAQNIYAIKTIKSDS